MNLTQTAAFFKKFSKYLFVFAIVYYLAILVLFPTGKTLMRAIFIKQDPPNPVYGLLPQLQFTQKKILNENPIYKLNTTNGKLPDNLPFKMTVYKFKPFQFSYQAGKNALRDAAILGYTESDLVSDLKGNVYKWRDLDTGGSLEINIDTREIKSRVNLSGKTNQYPQGNINEAAALAISKGLFKSLERFSDTLYQEGTQKVNLGYIPNATLPALASDARTAQIARIDFYRKIGDFPILGPDPSKGLMYAIVRTPSKDPSPLDYPEVFANYWEIETKSVSTYPIISVEEAWRSVSQNKGVMVSVIPSGSNPFIEYSPVSVSEILIDEIFLAYYENPQERVFLQPIFVFKGKYTAMGTGGGDITIYFPAITAEYVKTDVNK